MISIRNFLSLLLCLLFATLVACGGSGGGGDENPATTPTDEPPPAGEPPPDVTIEQLNGTWFGTFDDKTSVRTFEFTVDAGNMSAIKLADQPQTALTGTITKATEIPRAFRFTINSNGSQIAQGMMTVEPSGAYMLYVDQHFDFAVLQKGGSAHPAYAQTDIDGAWAGDVVSTTAGFTTFTQKNSSGQCAPTDPAPAPPTSQCAITMDSTARTASSVRLDHALGRFLGSFTDDPASSPPQNVAWRAFLSPDKSFAAVWACTDFTGGFPQTCDFSAWKKQ